MEVDDHLARFSSRVQRVQHHRAIGIAEGDVLHRSVCGLVAGNTHRARQQKFAGVAEHVVVQLRLYARMRCIAQVHRNQAAASIASAHKRSVILVRGQRPQHVSARPVAHHRDQLGGFFGKNVALVVQTLLPGAATGLGDPLVLGRKFLVILCHHRGVTLVVVPGRARGQRTGFGILQHGFRIVGTVPVMVVGHHPGSKFCRGQRGRKRFTQKRCLLRSLHLHAAIRRRRKQRLVLYAERPHRHARLLIPLNRLHQVARKGRIELAAQMRLHLGFGIRAEHGAGGLHPSRRAPRRKHDVNAGIDGQRLAQHRQNVLLIVRKREALQLRVGDTLRRGAGLA